ncbi:hypothetical protein [Actinocorallia longicatena]|uniref:MftR C-terminal domain-containing protein n=1 Tax=Actinocorallia longicatena TaxID=111803 RepID=A0ABP6QB39_9ACTN
MTTEAQVRRLVARRVWRTNPHSAVLGSVAVEMAKLLDQGDPRPMLVNSMRTTLSHFAECQAVPDDLDDLRATYARSELALFRDHPPTPHIE